jgi:hypothetical protein
MLGPGIPEKSGVFPYFLHRAIFRSSDASKMSTVDPDKITVALK